MLWPEEYWPVVEGIRSLRSAVQNQSNQQKRKTPRFLCVITSPDPGKEGWLCMEKQDDLVTLNLDVVEDYIGNSVANVVKKHMVCSLSFYVYYRVKFHVSSYASFFSLSLFISYAGNLPACMFSNVDAVSMTLRPVID
jgi:hypothetical protein